MIVKQITKTLSDTMPTEPKLCKLKQKKKNVFFVIENVMHAQRIRCTMYILKATIKSNKPQTK